jgi:hypothetical protein
VRNRNHDVATSSKNPGASQQAGKQANNVGELSVPEQLPHADTSTRPPLLQLRLRRGRGNSLKDGRFLHFSTAHFILGRRSDTFLWPGIAERCSDPHRGGCLNARRLLVIHVASVGESDTCGPSGQHRHDFCDSATEAGLKYLYSLYRSMYTSPLITNLTAACPPLPTPAAPRPAPAPAAGAAASARARNAGPRPSPTPPASTRPSAR